jgi:hypothetical protein
LSTDTEEREKPKATLPSPVKYVTRAPVRKSTTIKLPPSSPGLNTHVVYATRLPTGEMAGVEYGKLYTSPRRTRGRTGRAEDGCSTSAAPRAPSLKLLQVGVVAL